MFYPSPWCMCMRWVFTTYKHWMTVNTFLLGIFLNACGQWDYTEVTPKAEYLMGLLILIALKMDDASKNIWIWCVHRGLCKEQIYHSGCTSPWHKSAFDDYWVTTFWNWLLKSFSSVSYFFHFITVDEVLLITPEILEHLYRYEKWKGWTCSNSNQCRFCSVQNNIW